MIKPEDQITDTQNSDARAGGEDDLEPKSKAALKRDMEAFRKLGNRLVELSEEQLRPLEDPVLTEALLAAKKISRGSARKRQIQYIAKLLRKSGGSHAYHLVDRYDASSQQHNRHFHQLEQWRESLIEGDDQTIDEIANQYPDLDRQHLRQLIRAAQKEKKHEQEIDKHVPPAHYRKLFKYLKVLSDR